MCPLLLCPCALVNPPALVSHLRDSPRALAVRVNVQAPSSPSPPPSLGGADEPEPSLTMSATAKEEKLAAQLDAMRQQVAGSASTTGDDAASSSGGSDGRSAGPVLLGYGARPGGGAVGSNSASVGAGRGGNLLQLDGIQRLNLAGVVLLFAAGYGRGSAEVLDVATVESLRLAALAFAVAHVCLAGFGTLLAVQSGEAAAPWVIKILLTGAGGLQELRSRLAAKSAAAGEAS